MTSRPEPPVSRRAALAGLGAGGLGLALTSTRPAAAQEATPGATAGHPLVGTWVMEFLPEDDASAPVVNVFTADGIFFDVGADFAGVWAATGPTTAAFTFIGIIEEEGFSGYVAVRGAIEVDATGDAWTNTYAVMTVAADGTVVETGPPSTARARRLRLIAEGALGRPLAEVPAWTPALPEAATPAS
jgi:hypothetical protein